MKTKLITVFCALAVVMLSRGNVAAAQKGDPAAMTVDALLVRPFCFAATILGSAVFVVSLPVAAISKSVKPAANALVVRPAEATFTRPLGDLDSLVDY